MPEKIDIDEILKKNTHIHIEDLEKHKTLSEELRKNGMKPRGFQLAPPFARKHVQVDIEDEFDFRTINLTASRY